MKKNNKGFTLMELLAVIVILAILVAVAIPSVTKYLNDARKGSIENEAAELVTAARTYIVANNITKPGNFVFNIRPNGVSAGDKDGVLKSATWYPATGTPIPIENVVQKNLVNSPYGNKYIQAYVRVESTPVKDKDNALTGEVTTTFTLYLDDGVYCFKGVEESKLTEKGSLENTCGTEPGKDKVNNNPTSGAAPTGNQ